MWDVTTAIIVIIVIIVLDSRFVNFLMHFPNGKFARNEETISIYLYIDIVGNIVYFVRVPYAIPRRMMISMWENLV